MKRFLLPALLLTGAGSAAVGLAVLQQGGEHTPETAETPQHLAADSATPDAPASTERTAQPSAEADADAPRCSLEPGATAAWQVHHQTTTRLPQGGPPLEHHATGTLAAEVLLADNATTTLLARWDDPSLSEYPLHEDAFATPFLFRITRDCALDAFAHHPLTPLGVARQQQALLWELDWTWADEPDAQPAENALGPHLRVHATGRDDDGLLAQRAIRQYTRTWHDDTPLTPRLSLLSVRPGNAPWFARAEGEESLHHDEGTRLTRRLEAHLVPFPDGALDDAPRNLDTYRWAHLLPSTVTPRRGPRAITSLDREAHAALRHLDADDALARILQRTNAEESPTAILREASLWLEARPDQTEDLVRHIAESGLPGHTSNTLYMALGLARTSEARHWLEHVMTDEHAPPMHRTRAMLNLLDRDDVGQPLARQLAEQADRLHDGHNTNDRFMARQALLALGTMATMQQDPEIIQLAQDTAIRALSAGTTPDAIRPAIGAIANLGDPALLPEVEPIARHHDWEVRRAAARAIRRMPPQDTEAFVLDWLRREPSTFVRADLWTTIARQHRDAALPPSEALASLAAEQLHRNMPVRAQFQVIRLVGPIAQDHADVRNALVRLAREERHTRSNLTALIARHLDADALHEVFQ